MCGAGRGRGGDGVAFRCVATTRGAFFFGLQVRLHGIGMIGRESVVERDGAQREKGGMNETVCDGQRGEAGARTTELRAGRDAQRGSARSTLSVPWVRRAREALSKQLLLCLSSSLFALDYSTSRLHQLQGYSSSAPPVPSRPFPSFADLRVAVASPGSPSPPSLSRGSHSPALVFSLPTP